MRASTEQPRKIPQTYRKLLSELYPDPEFEYERPLTRADCVDAPRPCPFVSCRHHLYLDARDDRASIKFNFPDKEPWDLKHSCALDLVDGGAKTLDEVGSLMNLTRERVRQIEEVIFDRLGIDHDVVNHIIVHINRAIPSFSEDEMKVLEMAARVAEIERLVDELRIERKNLILRMEYLSKTKSTTIIEKPPEDEKPLVATKKTKITEEDLSVAQEWILSILRGGEWIPTRRLSSSMPDDVADDHDPSKLVQKAILNLAADGLIENGKPAGKSRSWRLKPTS